MRAPIQLAGYPEELVWTITIIAFGAGFVTAVVFNSKMRPSFVATVLVMATLACLIMIYLTFKR